MAADTWNGGTQLVEMPRRSFEEDSKFVSEDKKQKGKYHIKKGFVPNMRVPGMFYVNEHLSKLMFDELRASCSNPGGRGGFLPAVKQIANVSCLPGIVRASIAMPDCHSGYGFAIGNVAAFDMAQPEAVVPDFVVHEYAGDPRFGEPRSGEPKKRNTERHTENTERRPSQELVEKW